MATKEIEQRLKQEIERHQRNETISAGTLEPESGDNLEVRSNCNTLKMETAKLFGITKIGARIMSIITIGVHEVTRNLSEPSDQTLVHIDVYGDYLQTISPQTPSRALKALLTRVGEKINKVRQQIHRSLGSTRVHVEYRWNQYLHEDNDNV